MTARSDAEQPLNLFIAHVSRATAADYDWSALETGRLLGWLACNPHGWKWAPLFKT